MPDQGGSSAPDLDGLLEQMRQMLDQVRAGAVDPPPDEEDLRGTGEAADGQVRAVVGAGGRLETLTVNPRAMRLGSEALCEQIVTAVNAALDDLRAKADSRPVIGAVNLDALTAQVRDLHAESVRQMEKFTQSMKDALDRISRSTRR